MCSYDVTHNLVHEYSWQLVNCIKNPVHWIWFDWLRVGAKLCTDKATCTSHCGYLEDAPEWYEVDKFAADSGFIRKSGNLAS